MEKMTYSVALSTAISALSANAEYTEVCEKLTALSESIAKRNASKAGASRKPTKVQRENVEIKVQIAELLTSPMTATDVANAIGQTQQKASALLKQMVDAGVVVRTAPKGKAKATFVAVANA